MALPARGGFPVMHAVRGKLERLLALMRSGAPRPLPYDWFSDEEAGRYHQVLGSHPCDAVDEATAQDLHLAAYVRHLAGPCSIFARQYIVHRLRAGAAADDLAGVRARVTALQASGTARAAVVQRLAGLRAVESEVASFIFGDGGVTLPPWFNRIRHFDGLVLLLLAALLLWPSAWTGAALGACFVLAVLFQMRWYRMLQAWTRQRDTLLGLLRAAQALATARDELPPLLRTGVLATPAAIDGLIGTLRPGWLARVPALTEYLNLLFLHEYARAARDMAAIRSRRAVLGQVFEAVARAEAEAAIAALAAHPPPSTAPSTAPFCWAEPCAPAQLAVQDLVHPLLATPVALTVSLQGRGLFLSGRNGVGKSTLLRALGLAVLTARAFGYAHARTAALPQAAVWTSIQVQDSIAQGQSLYMAEMQRAAQLCRVAAQARPVVFIVDELFRGTNYVESVAACAATVQALSRAGLVIVASHNVVLATLLAPWLTALRLVRPAPGSDALVLEPGVVVDTNGVAMMQDYAFDPATARRAQRIQAWYAAYVTHPAQLPGDLLD